MKNLFLVLIMVLLTGCAPQATTEPEVVEETIDYSEEIKQLTYDMLGSAVDAEKAVNLIRAVWHDAIYEKSSSDTQKYVKKEEYIRGQSRYHDFSTAINLLYNDPEFAEKIRTIEDSQMNIELRMKKLTNIPDEYRTQYNDLRDMYIAYQRFAGNAVNATGSYNSYCDEITANSKEFLDKYNIMELYFE